MQKKVLPGVRCQPVMGDPLSPDSYGYTCSCCGSRDKFNEELLFYRPPAEVFRRSLQRLLDKVQITNTKRLPSVANIRHPLQCTKRLRHQPVACELVDINGCENTSHWRFCQGFYSVDLQVSFKLLMTKREVTVDNPSTEVQSTKSADFEFTEIQVMAILPLVKSRSCEGFIIQPKKKKKKGGGPIKGKTEVPPSQLTPDSYTIRDLARMWEELCDTIFKTNCAYWKIHHFYYVTNLARRLSLQKSDIIPKEEPYLIKQSRLSPLNAKKLGVSLGCGTHFGELPFFSCIGTQRILVPVPHVWNILESTPASHASAKTDVNLRLFFNSFHVCTGPFGADEYHVTLALVTSSNGAGLRFCMNSMVELSLKSNPVLQVDEQSKIMKVVESLENQRLRLWVEVFFFGDLTLDRNCCTWDELDLM